jgi:HEAT repeat protein
MRQLVVVTVNWQTLDEPLRRRLLRWLNRHDPDLRNALENRLKEVLRAVRSMEDLYRLATSSSSDRTQSLACWLIGEIGDPATAPDVLMQALTTGSETARIAAADALGHLRATRSSATLARALRGDESRVVRERAADALGSFPGDENATAALIASLDDLDEATSVRGHAAESLAYLGDARAVYAVKKALDDPAPELRFWACFALGSLGDETVLPRLRELESSDPGSVEDLGSIKEEAAEAIRAIKYRLRHRRPT